MNRRVMLLRLFPRPWRERYSDEFSALLDDVGVGPRTVVDVLLAAARARLDPNPEAWEWKPMADRLRNLELSIFAAWTAFVAAGAAFAKLTEEPPPNPLGPSQVPIGYDLLVIAAIASLVGVVIAGLPIGLAVVLDAVRRRRWSQLALVTTPVVAGIAWFGLTVALSSISFEFGDDIPRLIAFALWVGGGLVGVAASCVALALAARRAQVEARLYARAANPALLVVGGIVGGTVAVVVWGCVVFATDNYDFWGPTGLLATSAAASWLAIVVTMVLASAVAVRAAVGLRSSAT